MSNTQFNETTKSWDIIASRVYSGVNANLTLETFGTANLLIKTNGNILVTASSSENVFFPSPPICSVLPIVPSQIINKQYADSLISGPQGPQGSQGAQGAQGAQGVQGLQGVQGVNGDQGINGPQGYQGFQGAVGAQGNQGLQGGVGAQGSQGFKGTTGVQGNTGVVGDTGPRGDQGLKGVTGSQGSQGFKGSDGGIGPQGFQGPTGAQGNTGGPTNFTSNDNNVKFNPSTLTPPSSVVEVNLYPPLSLTSISNTALYITDQINMNSSDTSSRILFNNSTSSSFYRSISGNQNTFISDKNLSIILSSSSPGGLAAKGTTTSAGFPLYTYDSSSERYKTNIQLIPDNDEILNINPVIFNYKDENGNPTEKKHIGFIAEQMAENELGNYYVVRNEDNSCETINYNLLTPLYASSIRVLRERIKNFTNDLEAFKEDNNMQHNNFLQRISALQN